METNTSAPNEYYISVRSHKKNSRKEHERKPEVALKRIIQNADPAAKERRKKYAARPEVQTRRQELNLRRRNLVRAVMYMLQNGMLFNNEGLLVENLNGFLAIPARKTIIKVTKKGVFFTLNYENEMDLLTDKKFSQEPVDEGDVQLKQLVKRFVDGDPELESRLKKRKVVKEETEDIDFSHVREFIKSKFLDVSDSDDISDGSE